MPDRLLSMIASLMDASEEEVTENSNFETLKTWDSAREVELALMLEFEFGIRLTDDELSQLHSVREIRALLASHGVSRE